MGKHRVCMPIQARCFPLKFTWIQKRCCVICKQYEITPESEPKIASWIEPISIDRISDYFVEETSEGFNLIITIDNNPYFTYLVDSYNSWKETESAGKTLMS